ncbi:TPA: helix-turn-helix transcriptional regulator [Escherichia coli]
MKGQTIKDVVMTIKDVCELFQYTRRGVYKVMERHQDFPEPLARGHGVMLIWLKADMLAWYESHKDELAKVKGGRGVKKCVELQK